MIPNRGKVIFIPLITILIMVTSILLMLFFGYRTIEEVQEIIATRMGWALLNAAVTVTVFYFAVSWFNKKVDWNDKWSLRLLMDAGLVLVHASLGIWGINYLSSCGHFGSEHEHSRDFLYVVPLMMDTLFLVLIELIMGMEERNKLAIQVAHLEKEQINAKYSALKTQLDHHFLFNNLSVLSGIIYEDVEKADKFIQRFSQVYRYVLSINKRDLVSLEEEVEFIKSYLQLYKFRFEEGFAYEIDIATEKMDMMIAPLTLQVLVENAIKHNVVARNQPLSIKIYSEDNCLIVSNNLQQRDLSDIDSTNTGQTNIMEKYELLNYTIPVIKNDGTSYSVKITLIPPSHG
ncbi:sensor histidine kinase [Labilibacter marinus]|uniref:sensor histidine kinase n=1 Tax=Labilibacter marinus TaxID=1477105 RepID=UPI00082E466E|nr:histidine kinase [Labilibacter marinus]